MAYAFIGNVEAQSPAGAGGFTTGTLDTTGSSIIVAVLCNYTGVTGLTFTDNKSNTYTALANKNAEANGTVRIYYAVNPTVGSGHTFTIGGTLPGASLCVMAFSGANTSSPFDQQNGANSLVTQSGSITPTQDSELVVAGWGIGSVTSAPTIDSGFATVTFKADIVGQCYGAAMSYKIQTTAAAVNPTWSISGGCVIASFKIPAAAATFAGATIKRPGLTARSVLCG